MSLILNDEQRISLATKILKFAYGDTVWEHTGTVDDAGWRRVEAECLAIVEQTAQAQLDNIAKMTPENVREEIKNQVGTAISVYASNYKKQDWKFSDRLQESATEQICALMQAQIQKIKQDCEIEKQMLQEELCQTVAEAVEKERERIIKYIENNTEEAFGVPYIDFKVIEALKA